ncbi:hypothetical protein [Ammoniphilus sp. 3BR4]|uniref:hypothetical protein n=1 Tax=Ammoniphilus sp. 3BR4 TaxID=3158265 RepID=UPI003467B396
MNKIKPFLAIIFFVLITGCGTNDDVPFIFLYELNSIEEEHQERVNDWLHGVKNSNEAKIHSYGIEDGFEYLFAKGYKDISVSFIYEDKKGEKKGYLKTDFIKGEVSDTVFLKVKYNPLLCCDTIIIDSD